MAKQEFEQGDSNVVVRNQVVYGALPQDVIDRMGDTTLALQTTEQNVLPAINELKSNLTEITTYSQTEQVIGEFLNKPLYRRVFDLGSNLTVHYNTWTNTNISNSNILFIVNSMVYTAGGTHQGFFEVNRDTGSYVQLLQVRNVNVTARWLVLEYTKIND